MATIAYVGLPAHGHVNPSVPVMKRLVELGHRVLYYNGETMRAKLAVTGVEFRPFPEPMPTAREISHAMRDMLSAALLLVEMSRPLTQFMVEQFAEMRPDLVLYDSGAMWGYVAARYHQIPNINLVTTFVLDGSERTIGVRPLARHLLRSLPHLPHMIRWKREMAATYGSENAGGITIFADLNIVFTSQAFHPPNRIVDERFQFVGPAIDESVRDGDFPIEKLATGRSVYISLGTINHLNDSFYKAAFEAFRDMSADDGPIQFILAIGQNSDPGQLEPIPDNFIVRRYVPQLAILQHVDAFVTHGGMNSVHEGLYYNVPLVVVPQHMEQLLNGKRVAQCGAGVLLAGRRQNDVAALRGAVEEVLNRPKYRHAASEIGETLRTAGGYQRAAELIDEAATSIVAGEVRE